MKKFLLSIGVILGMFTLTACDGPSILQEDGRNVINQTKTRSTENEQEQQEYTQVENEKVDYETCYQHCLAVYQGVVQEGKISCERTCKTAEKLSDDDIRACDNIDEVIEQNIKGDLWMKTVCVIDKATKQKQPNWCERLNNQDQKDMCYMSVANKLQDKNICNKIKNPIYKVGCNVTEDQ